MSTADDIDYADYRESLRILTPLYWYMNGLFFVMTLGFVALMVVLCSAAVQKSLSIYSFCLASNVCTIYLFDILMFLLKPVIVPSGVYVLLDGPIRFLPVAGRFALIFLFTFFLLAHVVAMGVSVLYQYVQITSFTPLKRLFQNHASTALVFALISTGFFVFFGSAIFRINRDFFPGAEVDANDQILNDLLQTSNGFVRFNINRAMGIVVLLVIFSLAVVIALIVLGSVVWDIHRYANKNVGKFGGQSLSSKTLRMQMDLVRSVTAQTVAVVLIYIIPIYIVFCLILLKPSFSNRLTVSLHFILYSYAPINYLMIFVFVPRLRAEVLQMIWLLWRLGKRKSTTCPISFS